MVWVYRIRRARLSPQSAHVCAKDCVVADLYTALPMTSKRDSGVVAAQIYADNVPPVRKWASAWRVTIKHRLG